jgi:hypothetical protein
VTLYIKGENDHDYCYDPTCPAGQDLHLNGNAATCQSCIPGQHKSTQSGSSCSVCPPGTYQNNSGGGSCINCPKGTYLKLAGAAIDHDSLDDCQECNIFQFNPFEGHDQECFMCLTASTTGSIQCDGCYPGTCVCCCCWGRGCCCSCSKQKQLFKLSHSWFFLFHIFIS